MESTRIAFLILAVLLAVVLDFWIVTRAQSFFEKRGVQPGTGARLRYLWRGGGGLFSHFYYWLNAKIPRPIWVLLHLFAISLIVASFKVYNSNTGYRNWLHWLLLVTGVAFFWTGWKSHRVEYEPISEAYYPKLESGQLICFGLSLILTIVASQLVGFAPKSPAAITGFVLWLMAILLAIISALDNIDVLRVKPDQTSIIHISILFIIALGVRMYDVRHIPVFLSGDEGSSGIFALKILSGDFNNPFTVGWFSFPSLYFFIQTIFIKIFGQTVEALRYLSALGGALTVGLVYWLGQRIFDRRSALFASILMLVFHYHNHFSRIGLNNVWDGLWVLLALGCIWQGYQNEKRGYYVLAGLALGISQYFYASARLLFFVIPFWLVLTGVLDFQKLKRQLPNIGVMFLIAGITFFPLARFFVQHPSEFLAPMTRVGITSKWLQIQMDRTQLSAFQIVTNQILLGLKGFVHIPIRLVYTPKTPLLRLPEAVVLVTAIGLLLKDIRNPRTLLFLSWIGLFGIMVGISSDTPASQRYIAVAPAVILLVGFGLSEIISRFSSLLMRGSKVISLIGIIILLLISADELRYYYQTYTQDFSHVDQNGLVAQRLADYLQTKDSSWEVLLFATRRMGYYSLSSLPYQAPGIRGYDINKPWGSSENPQPTSKNLLFVFLPGHEDDLNRVRLQFPESETRIIDNNLGKVLFYFIEVQIQ